MRSSCRERARKLSFTELQSICMRARKSRKQRCGGIGVDRENLTRRLCRSYPTKIKGRRSKKRRNSRSRRKTKGGRAVNVYDASINPSTGGLKVLDKEKSGPRTVETTLTAAAQREAEIREEQVRELEAAERRAAEEERARKELEAAERRRAAEEEQARKEQEAAERRRAAEEERVRKEQEEEEKQRARMEQEEAERRRAAEEERARKEQEETERRRTAEEERVRKEQEAAERRRAAEEERFRKEQEAAERRRAAEEERVRKEKEAAERRRAAEEERVRKEQEAAERRRAAEEERVRKEQEEEEKQRARMEQEEAERRRAAEEERARKEQEAAERRRAAEEEQARKEQEAAERRRAAEEERARIEAEGAELLSLLQTQAESVYTAYQSIQSTFDSFPFKTTEMGQIRDDAALLGRKAGALIIKSKLNNIRTLREMPNLMAKILTNMTILQASFESVVEKEEALLDGVLDMYKDMYLGTRAESSREEVEELVKRVMQERDAALGNTMNFMNDACRPYVFQVAMTLPFASKSDFVKRTLIISPTGSGKTFMYSMMILGSIKLRQSRAVIVRKSPDAYVSQFEELLLHSCFKNIPTYDELDKTFSFGWLQNRPSTKAALALVVAKFLKMNKIKEYKRERFPNKSNPNTVAQIRAILNEDDYMPKIPDQGPVRFECFSSLGKRNEDALREDTTTTYFIDEVHELFTSLASNPYSSRYRQQFIAYIDSEGFRAGDNRVVGLTATPGVTTFFDLMNLFSSRSKRRLMTMNQYKVLGYASSKFDEEDRRRCNDNGDPPQTPYIDDETEKTLTWNVQENVCLSMFAEDERVKDSEGEAIYPTLVQTDGVVEHVVRVDVSNVENRDERNHRNWFNRPRRLTSYHRFDSKHPKKGISTILAAEIQKIIERDASKKTVIYVKTKAVARRIHDAMDQMKIPGLILLPDAEDPGKDEYNEAERAVMISNADKAATSITLKGTNVLIKIGIFDALKDTQINGRVRRIRSHHQIVDPSNRKVKRYVLIPSVSESSPPTCDNVWYDFLQGEVRFTNILNRVMWNSSMVKSAFSDLKPEFCDPSAEGCKRPHDDEANSTTPFDVQARIAFEADDPAAHPEISNQAPNFVVSIVVGKSEIDSQMGRVMDHCEGFCQRSNSDTEGVYAALQKADGLVLCTNETSGTLHGFAVLRKITDDTPEDMRNGEITLKKNYTTQKVLKSNTRNDEIRTFEEENAVRIVTRSTILGLLRNKLTFDKYPRNKYPKAKEEYEEAMDKRFENSNVWEFSHMCTRECALDEDEDDDDEEGKVVNKMVDGGYDTRKEMMTEVEELLKSFSSEPDANVLFYSVRPAENPFFDAETSGVTRLTMEDKNEFDTREGNIRFYIQPY